MFAVDRKGIPQVVFAREKGDQSHWALRNDHRIDRSQVRVLEAALECRLVQIIQVDGTIVTASSEHAHCLANEDGRNLPLVIAQLLEKSPRIGGAYLLGAGLARREMARV